MVLALQIVLFIVAVVGVIATAATLTDPLWRKVGITGSILLGLVGVILHLATNETTQSIIASTWSGFVTFVQTRGFQIVLALLIGVAIGIAGRGPFKKLFHRAMNPPDKRLWLSNVDIYAWAGKERIRARNEAFDRSEAALIAWHAADDEKSVVLAGLGAFASFTENPTPEVAEAQRKAEGALQNYGNAGRELQRLEAELRNTLHDRLVEGTLLAKGFLPPFSHQSVDVDIPPSQWRFLRFDKDMESAEGQGVKYIGVTVTDPKHRR